jgi:predicted transposase YbfD/YdcC
MLALEGAIVTIDAMGTQKTIAAAIIAKKADYVLALKGNQGTLQEDAALVSAPPPPNGSPSAIPIGKASPASSLSQRTARPRRPARPRPGRGSPSRPCHPIPSARAAAVRAHWSVENNLQWRLDVAFREDESRIRKDLSARNLAMIRRAVLNRLRREPSTLSLKRKRLKAVISPDFRTAVLAA